MSARLLIVDDDRTFRLSTAALLRQDGHEVAEAPDGQAAIKRLESERFDLILLDLRMPGLDGIGLVEVLRTWGHDTPILMISGFGTVDTAVDALHTGADDFLTKPVEPDVLSARVEELLERRPVREHAIDSRPSGILGRSAAIRSVLEVVGRVAPTDATVLVTGETGTGKELVARAIHDGSDRSEGPFVAVNCASLAEGLLESELFGHEKGAFTGAVRQRKGHFEAAAGGTLLLDEIGDVSPGVQHRLLRVLQERELTPVGSSRPVSVDVRVVAATNKDLRTEMEAGRFRDDLYYRLNVVRIELPPLRARKEDIPLLVEAFNERVDRPSHRGCSPMAMRLLQGHRWPGNVRELFAALQSAHIRAGDRRIEAQHLPGEVRGSRGGGSEDAEGERYRSERPAADERSTIVEALERAGGTRTAAARQLGMSRTTLWRKMKEYGIDG
ncbi:MAG: sigma-54-dependent Fis family transcriptional regulator [Gemmatimonadetes bacterium]|nr:sigma-54 dependent transcriptional regulator [Gemmatimonadota bacterium]NNF13196.1 sigma-54-dependent Fis family transcriptional regulator [Gemmatimonadota bacterium]